MFKELWRTVGLCVVLAAAAQTGSSAQQRSDPPETPPSPQPQAAGPENAQQSESESSVPSAAQQAEMERLEKRQRRAQIAAYRRAQQQVHAVQRAQRANAQASALHRIMNPFGPANLRASYQQAQAYQQAAQNTAANLGARTTPYYEHYFYAQGW
jgi:hypothetical protein